MRDIENPEPFAVDAVLEQMEWAEEKRKNRKIIERINAQRREQKVPLNRARLWQVAILSFLVSLLIALYALFPLAWRIFR